MSAIIGAEAVPNHEEQELIQMEALLLSLLKDEIITSIEYRLIVSSRKLSDKQSAVFKILVSKNRLGAVNLLDQFRKLNSRVNPSVRHNRRDVANFNPNEKHPLLMNTVISILFTVLPFEDIKLCRLVCQQWNLIGEMALRKKTAINFKPGHLEPTAFLDIYKYSLPHLPFTDFIFSSSGKGNPWCTSELDEFFNTWGDNIKSLTFNQIYLKDYKEYDVTSWVEKARNLEKMKINCCCCNGEGDYVLNFYLPHTSDRTTLELQLDKVTSLKSLSAKKCVIILDPTKSCPRFSPLEIQLNAVTWKLRGGTVLRSIILNDFIDFGQASNINVVHNRINDVTTVCRFDMACPLLDTRKFSASGIELVNWGRARGNMDLISLHDLTFEAPNQLYFKQLFLKYCNVNLTLLPQCIEKLYVSICNQLASDRTIQLPNLRFLCYEAAEPVSRDLIGNFLSYFSNCFNLSELELIGENILNCLTLDVDLVPRSVRKMKIRYVKLVGDNHYELDTLIIEGNHLSPLFIRTAKVMLKIHCRVLVVKCLRLNKGLKTPAIITFLKKNTQLETIVVGTEQGVDLHANVPFEGSVLSRWVDEKSNYYKFQNNRGQSLTSREFETLSNLNGLDLDNPERF